MITGLPAMMIILIGFVLLGTIPLVFLHICITYIMQRYKATPVSKNKRASLPVASTQNGLTAAELASLHEMILCDDIDEVKPKLFALLNRPR